MVDDEPDITLTLGLALEDSNFFQVKTFNDPKLALSGFSSGMYDLALLDIRMPEMNGFQLFRKLRDIDNKLKVCFITAAELLAFKDTDSDIINSLGRDFFINKPVNAKDLIARLKTLISRKS